MNDRPALVPVACLAPGETLQFPTRPGDLLDRPVSGPFQFFEIEHGHLVIIGRGHTVDLAAQLTIENARDWRRLDRMTRRFADSLPETAVSRRRRR